MVTEVDVACADGRTLHAYDTDEAAGQADRLAVFWHHGTPNTGAPPKPLLVAADRLNLRWVSYDRPGYGGSSPSLDRAVASAAEDVATVADALACAALLPDRLLAVVSAAGLAPFDAAGLDWFAGMAPSGEASLRAAAAGRSAKERHEAAAGDEEDIGFIPADYAALDGDWSWFGEVVGPALAAGPGGLIEDDLAYVRSWGFDPAHVHAPVLLLPGGRDRMVPSSHSAWLAGHCRTAVLRLSPGDGHISILTSAESALCWLREQSDAR